MREPPADAPAAGDPVPPDPVRLRGVPLVLRRAWPSEDGLRVEYATPDGELLLGAWLRDPAGPPPDTGPWERPEAAPALRLRPAGLDPALPGLAPALVGGGLLVAHRLGRRAVVRTPDGSYLKLVRRGRGPELARHHAILAAALDGVARVPRVLAVRDDAVELAPLAGVALGGEPGPHDGAAAGDPVAWHAVGLLVGAIARARPDGLPVHDLAAEVATTARWLGAARAAGRLPVLAVDAALALLARLDGSGGARGAGARARAPVLAHRDLHDGQLRWDGATAGLLDPDTLALADPSLDLANLLVHLELRELQGSLDAAGRRSAAAAVVAAAGDPSADPGPLALHARTARLRLAAVHAFRPRWRSAALDLLRAGTGDAPPA